MMGWEWAYFPSVLKHFPCARFFICICRKYEIEITEIKLGIRGESFKKEM